MRAILLAAGYGTRLRPLTESIPKCLVPINGEPLLALWLKRLTQAGFGPFLINTHYLADRVSEYVDASPYRNSVTLVHESQLRGTAGTLVDNLEFFKGEDGLLIHADNYCLADFQAFRQAHERRPPECVLTMMTFRTNDPSACGIVELNEIGVVVGFHEKVTEPPGNLANGAIYAVSPELLRIMHEELNAATDFSTEVLQKFIGRIYTHESDQVFLDIGTPENYKKANSLTESIWTSGAKSLSGPGMPSLR
jgi:mannose-1-phosphate guanylyltransferase